MLKRLAIFAVLLTVAPMVSGQPNKAPDQKQAPAKQSQPAVLLANGQNKQASSQTDQPKPDGNQKGPDKHPVTPESQNNYTAWGFWVNFGLTAITLLIAIAAVIQASAAKLGAKAMLRSERAWLLPDGEKIGMVVLRPVEQQVQPQKTPVQCSIALRNCGNTPASAIDWQFELQLGVSADTPPSLEIYTRKPQNKSLTPFPIGQDRLGHGVAILTPREYINAFEQGQIWDGSKILWLCGVARYNDVFEKKRWLTRKPEEHCTFVCLRYICAPDGSNGQWFLGGPSGYNKAT
ncbi:MAG TPA: hypothetical protein VKG86_12165 [Terracidiphilus sp.]|nr:hypothetical protein [Terracidiphilus sp.]